MRADMSLGALFATLSAVIIIRTYLEKLLSEGHRMLFTSSDFYACIVGDLHMYFSWVCIFLSMSVPLAVFLGVRYRDAIKLTLIGFCITVFVPLADYAATWGNGDEIRYFRSFDSFLYNYINLFNPFASMKGVTAGVRLEVLTLFFGSFLVSLSGFRRGFVRSALLAFSLYTVVYVYGYILPIHKFLGMDLDSLRPGSAAGINGAQALFFAYLGPFLLSLAGIALVMLKRERGSGKIIACLFYPSRLLFYLWLLCFGFLYTAEQVGIFPNVLNRTDLLRFTAAAISIALLFVYAKLINDEHDLEIDRVSNPERPLPNGNIGRSDARGLAAILAALSLVLAVPVERDFFYVWACLWGLSYIYSSPPFRLRRFWPLGHLTLALIGTGVFLAGACVARPDDFYAVLEHKEIIAYVLLAFFCLAHVKDLKDIEGDRAGGVFNIFGRVSSPKLLGLAFGGGFLLVASLIAIHIGLGTGAVLAGGLACAAGFIFIAWRAKAPAGLDYMLVASFLFLLYLSGLWTFHFIPAG